MLVLSRRTEETIVIEGQIEIQVLRIKGNTVRLGIKAPADVKILRGELAPFGVEELTFEIDSITGEIIGNDDRLKITHGTRQPLPVAKAG